MEFAHLSIKDQKKITAQQKRVLSLNLLKHAEYHLNSPPPPSLPKGFFLLWAHFALNRGGMSPEGRLLCSHLRDNNCCHLRQDSCPVTWWKTIVTWGEKCCHLKENCHLREGSSSVSWGKTVVTWGKNPVLTPKGRLFFCQLRENCWNWGKTAETERKVLSHKEKLLSPESCGRVQGEKRFWQATFPASFWNIWNTTWCVL